VIKKKTKNIIFLREKEFKKLYGKKAKIVKYKDFFYILSEEEFQIFTSTVIKGLKGSERREKERVFFSQTKERKITNKKIRMLS
jgi:hypothetical protein